MWVLRSRLMEPHHRLMFSQGPVSAEDLPFTISRPVFFSQSRYTVRNSVCSLPDKRVETNKEKVHEITEKRGLIPHPYHDHCLVLCSGWIPQVSVESLVLASVLLVLCVFLLWNFYLCERWKNSEIGMPWTAQYPWGMDHIYYSVKDLEWFLELCGKCTERCLINFKHLSMQCPVWRSIRSQIRDGDELNFEAICDNQKISSPGRSGTHISCSV